MPRPPARRLAQLLLALAATTNMAAGSNAAAASGTGSSAHSRFSAVWNCPYMGPQVAGKYGLTANPSGSFNGTEMVLFYGPKTWPSLTAAYNPAPAATPCWKVPEDCRMVKCPQHPCTWNQTAIWANITVASNGGVPQAGDIELHKAAVAAMVEAMIPDPEFSGYAIFDQESWRVMYGCNDYGLSYSNHYSDLLVQRQNPGWNATRISQEAERQYNAGARLFFTETLRTAKKLRPKGKFGFYEYPLGCHATPGAYPNDGVSPDLLWLWQEVGVMAGSDYMRTSATTASSVNRSIAAVNLAEAAARAAGTVFVRPDILVYVWLWPSAKPVSAEQLDASIRVPAAMGADGIILWGSSGDAHVSGYDDTLTAFLASTVGPLIEKCQTERTLCATSFCSGHGRCSSYDVVHPERGCQPLETDAAVVCLCDAGYHGAACSKQKPPAAKSMLVV